MIIQKARDEIKIIDFITEHQSFFETLNRQWIEIYFEMEAPDFKVLQDPQTYIIDEGGVVLFAETSCGEIVGTVALKAEDEDTFELAKMAVAEKERGRGIGRLLCEAAIERARARGAKKIVLYTNTILEPAIRLYRKLGFDEVPAGETNYKRINLKMEKNFVENHQRD